MYSQNLDLENWLTIETQTQIQNWILCLDPELWMRSRNLTHTLNSDTDLYLYTIFILENVFTTEDYPGIFITLPPVP